MKLVVKDANVLIDLAHAGLLESWFQLGIPTCTTDLVLRQVKREPEAAAVIPFVESKLLEIVSLSGDQLRSCFLKFGHLRIGIEDSSVLLVAQERAAILLTGDGAMRKLGLQTGIEVRGLIWIFDKLVERKAVTARLAAIKLQAVIEAGAFLPLKECERRIAEWSVS